MRNKASKEDIDRVLERVKIAWAQYPHLRLGQLLLNITRDHTGQTNKHILWNADEDELVLKLEDLLKHGW